MASETRRVLSTVADLKGGYAFKSEEYTESGRFVLRTVNIREDGRITRDGATYISEARASEYERFDLEADDTLFVMVGATLGKVGFVKACDLPALLNQNMWVIRSKNKETTHPRFLNYWFHWKVEETLQWASGSARGFVRRDDYRNIPFPEVNYGDQRAIAEILGALDDKIELNRQTSNTLERVARAIFRAWFVDFAPVKAKASGAHSFLGMPQDAFDALPTRFVESELGPVPEGWMVGSIGDVVEMRMERIDPSEETARRPYVPIECISPKSLSLQDWKPGSEAQSSLQRFYRGDILFGAMRPYFHKVCLAPFDGTTRTTAFVLVPRRTSHYAYATMLVHDQSTVDYATQHSVGSTIPYAKWERSLANMPIVHPPASLLEEFEKIVRPMLEPFMQSPFENVRLRALRDYLLPKLLSGEVRVADVGGVLDKGPMQ